MRAYSMLLDAGRRTFNLTVKVYPGGPPHTRGTSAFLGAAPVGTFVEVPETRAMLWSSSPSPSPRRVGMVAFGVGMAEWRTSAAAPTRCFTVVLRGVATRSVRDHH